MSNQEESIESLKEEISLHDKSKQTNNKSYLPKESYNQVTYDYTKEEEKAKLAHLPKKYLKSVEDDENNNNNSNNNNKDHFIDPLENLTPAQRKIYELKKKLESTKSVIYKSVVDEHKRIHQGAQDEIDEKRKLYKDKLKQEDEEMKKQGLDPEKERLKNVIADELKTNKKKGGKKLDKNSFTDEHVYNSYKKRVKGLEQYHKSDHFKEVVSKDNDKQLLSEGGIGEVEYGKSIEIPRENINAMKQELLKNQEARRSFKRKGYNEDKDVDYINEENRIYNQKTARAYDKYTLETRQNLERGTAL